jgi:sulfonate transport system substrate-binding protein
MIMRDVFPVLSLAPQRPRQVSALQRCRGGILLCSRSYYIARLLIAVVTLCFVDVVFAAAPLTLGIATVPHSLQFFVAEHEGYFAQELPQLRLIDCFPGRKCLNMLLAGGLQFATVADTPIVSASFVRSDFVVLASFASSSNDIRVVGAKSAGIARLKDLVGKKIGIIKGSSAEYFLDTALLFDGIDPARVQKFDMPVDDIIDALRQHKIDAFVLFEPGLSKAVTALGESVNVLVTPPIYLSTFNLVAQRSLIGKNDIEMVKILRALDRAQTFIQQHPEAAQRIMRERLKMPPPTGKSLSIQMDYALSLDQTFIKTLEGEARWFSQQKGTVGTRPVNYLDLIYLPPLLQVRPKSVTIVK